VTPAGDVARSGSGRRAAKTIKEWRRERGDGLETKGQQPDQSTAALLLNENMNQVAA
jgi:hypothetical protein